MATITGGPLVVQAESAEEYAELLSNANADAHIEVVSTDEPNLRFTINLI